MTDAVRIGVTGASGRMGRALVRTVRETEGATLAAVLERPGHGMVGADAGEALGLGERLGIAVSDDPWEALASCRAVLDFTAPAASVGFAEVAAQAKLCHVIGTTGFDAAQIARIEACARHAAIVRAGNMSLGVNLLVGLARKVGAALGEDWDVEVVEAHHARKADAPSGTALMLGEAVALGRGTTLDAVAERGRDGITGPRTRGRIGFHAIRGGDVVGEHDVIFHGAGERVVLRHLATDRDIFARGAVRAALWGAGQPPGRYDMEDVLGLR